MKAFLLITACIMLASCVPTKQQEEVVKVDPNSVITYEIPMIYYDDVRLADMDNDGFTDIVFISNGKNYVGQVSETVITVVRNVVGPWVSNDRR
jgi:hypothetical protein